MDFNQAWALAKQGKDSGLFAADSIYQSHLARPRQQNSKATQRHHVRQSTTPTKQSQVISQLALDRQQTAQRLSTANHQFDMLITNLAVLATRSSIGAKLK